jgi:hypothetical protein
MERYQITGEDGIWEMVSGYVDDNSNVVLIFQNIGSGRFIEVDVCPFDWILKIQQKNK